MEEAADLQDSSPATRGPNRNLFRPSFLVVFASSGQVKPSKYQDMMTIAKAWVDEFGPFFGPRGLLFRSSFQESRQQDQLLCPGKHSDATMPPLHRNTFAPLPMSGRNLEARYRAQHGDKAGMFQGRRRERRINSPAPIHRYTSIHR